MSTCRQILGTVLACGFTWGAWRYADRSSVPGELAASPALRGDMPTDPRCRTGLLFHLGCVVICRQILGAGLACCFTWGAWRYADKCSVPVSRQARTCGSAAICRQMRFCCINSARVTVKLRWPFFRPPTDKIVLPATIRRRLDDEVVLYVSSAPFRYRPVPFEPAGKI